MQRGLVYLKNHKAQRGHTGPENLLLFFEADVLEDNLGLLESQYLVWLHLRDFWWRGDGG